MCHVWLQGSIRSALACSASTKFIISANYLTLLVGKMMQASLGYKQTPFPLTPSVIITSSLSPVFIIWLIRLLVSRVCDNTTPVEHSCSVIWHLIANSDELGNVKGLNPFQVYHCNQPLFHMTLSSAIVFILLLCRHCHCHCNYYCHVTSCHLVHPGYGIMIIFNFAVTWQSSTWHCPPCRWFGSHWN